MTRIPLEIWELIAELTDPNPLVYTSWAHVCHDSRAVFFRDLMWRKFSPEDSNGSHLAVSFHLRVSKWTPQLLSMYKQLFIEIERSSRWLASPQFQLVTVPDIMEKRKEIAQNFGQSADYDLICVCWLHIISPIWWSESVRNDPIHAMAIQQRNPCFTCRDFAVCAARLYGPLLRYFPTEYLDDEEIVLLSAKYHAFGVDYPGSENSELARWRKVTPLSVVSERLKRDPQIVQAFVSRWPYLVDELPKSAARDN